jgi:DNA-binding NarL/FixJ family response regulator
MRERRLACDALAMPLRVVIVDDSDSFIDAARVLLERQGVSVVGVASTIAEALGRAEQLRPDVILVDIKLAGESGFECARRLDQHDNEVAPTLILISTHAEEDLADLIAESPAAGFVAKSELSAAAIRRILDRRPR